MLLSVAVAQQSTEGSVTCMAPNDRPSRVPKLLGHIWARGTTHFGNLYCHARAGMLFSVATTYGVTIRVGPMTDPCF
jgi:hypothetical protein